MGEVERSGWDAARRVLAVRLDTLGDVLMTTPALRALKEGGRHVTLLTSPQGEAVARLVPEIDEVLVYDAPWMKATGPRGGRSPDLACIETLRAGRFDAAVVFTVYSQNPLPSAMLAYLADIPLRLAHCRENPYQLLTDWVKEREPEGGIRHEVRRQLDLVASVGCLPSHERLSLRPPPQARRAVDARLRALGLAHAGNWIALHPGASAPSRRYPPEFFARAVRELSLLGIRTVFTGGPDEVDLVEGIRAEAGVESLTLAGQLPLPELAALIERAPLLLSNNTGPAHVAAAVGTPVVDLYALTNPQHTPWAVPSKVLNQAVPCAYCYKSVCPEGHHLCLRGVAPEAVVKETLDLLNSLPIRPDRAQEQHLV